MGKMLRRYIPNTISLLRVGLTMLWGRLYAVSGPPEYIFLLALIIIVSDKVDGTLARRWKCESVTGELLDGLADALFVMVSWILFYFKGLYGIPLLLLLLAPRLLVGLERGLFRAVHKKWNLTHYSGNRLGAVANFIAILWILAGLPGQLGVLYIMLAVVYATFVISLFERWAHKKILP